jgi:hypothetical protein
VKARCVGRWFLSCSAHGLAFAVLTLITQVGGLFYALALLLRSKFFAGAKRPITTLALLFASAYLAAWAPVGWLARIQGRTGLPCFASRNSTLAASPLTCILHRHYVSPEMKALAQTLSEAVNRRFPETLTIALDGNFPFIDGFPLLPHLSHDDGRKLDMAFYYSSRNAYARGAMKSPVGYWAFEERRAGEGRICSPNALSWDMAWLQPLIRRDLALDRDRTRYALNWLAGQGPRHGLGKVFIEPHLAQRFGVRGAAIRFQGCRAARHDDHFHLQLR